MSKRRTAHKKRLIDSLVHAPGRDVTLPGNGKPDFFERMQQIDKHFAIITFSYILERWDTGNVDKDLFLLNLISDMDGALLLARELVHRIVFKGVNSRTEGWKTLDTIALWEEKGYITKVKAYCKALAMAREAILTQHARLKGLSKPIIDEIIYVLDNPSSKIVADIQPLFAQILAREDARHNYDGRCTQHKRGISNQQTAYIKWVEGYKLRQQQEGITVSLLEDMIRDLLPGNQQQRRHFILATLIKHYDLLSIQEDLPEEESKANLETGKVVLEQKEEPPLTSDHPNTQIAQAINTVVKTAKKYTKAIRRKIADYEDKDHIDTRQRARMMREVNPLPVLYELKGENSPRVYPSQPDTLAACRKGLRLHALSGLGAYDVDLTSCHSFILTSIWQKTLPLLKKALEEGNLWEIYKEHFQAQGLPFNKKAVKPMHYASVLGGGRKALLKAIDLHNKSCKDKDLKIEDAEAYTNAFKNAPIFKELKRVLRSVTKWWKGRKLSLSSGHKLEVKTSKEDNNILTAIAAFLQDKEIRVMTHVINRASEWVDILLWQHDGLTVIPKKEGWQEALQRLVDDAVSLWIKQTTRIALTFDPIP